MTPQRRVAFLVWDDAGGLFLRVELTSRAEPPAATAAVLGWVGARPVYAFGLAVDSADAGDPGPLAAGGLRATEADAGAWRLELDDGPNRLALRFEPFTAAIPYDLPAGLAAGHHESACRVSGHVELSGHVIAVDGVGQCRRTLVVADPSDPADDPRPGWRSATGYLGPSARPVGAPATEVAFSLWEPAGAGGARSGVHGFVHQAGVDTRLEAVETVDGDPWHLTLRTAGGRRLVVRGHPHGAAVPVRPAGAGEASTAVLSLQLVRWEADGLDGYGLVERLDHPATTS